MLQTRVVEASPTLQSPAPVVRRIAAVAGRLALGLFVTTIILALVEFVLVAVDYSRPIDVAPPIRLFSQERQKEIPEAGGMFRFDPYVYWDLRPGAVVVDQESEVINAAGFRGDLVALDRSARSLRVACLGDSSIFGVGSSLQESFPQQLREDLASRWPPELGRDVEVINAGVPGYTAFQGLQALQRKVLPYRPDVVVLMFGAFNECLPRKPPILTASPKRGRALRMAPSWVLAEILAAAESVEGDDSADVLPSFGPGFAHVVMSKLQRFRLVQLLASILPAPSANAARDELESLGDSARGVEKGDSSPPRVSLKAFGEFMSAMIEISLHSGAKVVILGPPRREDLRRLVPAVTRFNPISSEVARRWGVPFVDLEPIFDKDPALFIEGDPVHPNSGGHKVIARSVADWIVKNAATVASR